jgi:hypothetical protein
MARRLLHELRSLVLNLLGALLAALAAWVILTWAAQRIIDQVN